MALLEFFLKLVIFCLCLSQSMTQNFEKQCFKAHNAYRNSHGTRPLILDHSLSIMSQKWADRLANTGELIHTPHSDYGENIGACFHCGNVTGEKVVKLWYDEIKDYDFDHPHFNSNTGHFTQVLWKDTKRMGCAVAVKGVANYIVATYVPSGNWRGKFTTNVLRKK